VCVEGGCREDFYHAGGGVKGEVVRFYYFLGEGVGGGDGFRSADERQ